jgi:glycerophosphoryl diester phosphodiesterase
VQQRLPSLLDDPIAFAHRGARAHSPENTLEAFALALRLGATGLESDVWVTADGVPVLDHDGVLRSRWGRRVAIATARRADLPRHIPTLDELVAHCGTRYHLSLDLKDAAGGRRVIEVLGDVAADLLQRTWLCSPRWESLLELRGQGAKLVDSTRLARIKEGPERRAAILAREGIDAVNLHHSDWNGGLVALFHRFDRVVFGWDMQEPHILAAGLRMGLDGVFSDWTDRMVEVYTAELGAPRPVT